MLVPNVSQVPFCLSPRYLISYQHQYLLNGYFYLRCVIPECDNEEHPRYEVDWVDNIIPSTESKRSKCHRYQQYPVNSSQNFYNYDQVIFDESRVEFCNKPHSTASKIVRCDQDGLVYKTDELSIVNEVIQQLNILEPY